MRWRAICERRFERVVGDRTGFVPLDSNTDQPLDGPPGPAVSPIAEQPPLRRRVMDGFNGKLLEDAHWLLLLLLPLLLPAAAFAAALLLSAKLLRLLQLRCSPTATSFFHSQKVVLRNTGLLSSAAHAQCSLSNPNDCTRCAATEDCAAVLACAAQPKSGGESVPSRS